MFYKDKSKIDGLRTECKKCKKIYKIFPTSEEVKIRHRDDVKKHRQTVAGRYGIYARNAKRRKLEFLITFVQFKVLSEQKCVYCGKFSPHKNFARY